MYDPVREVTETLRMKSPFLLISLLCHACAHVVKINRSSFALARPTLPAGTPTERRTNVIVRFEEVDV